MMTNAYDQVMCGKSLLRGLIISIMHQRQSAEFIPHCFSLETYAGEYPQEGHYQKKNGAPMTSSATRKEFEKTVLTEIAVIS